MEDIVVFKCGLCHEILCYSHLFLLSLYYFEEVPLIIYGRNKFIADSQC